MNKYQFLEKLNTFKENYFTEQQLMKIVGEEINYDKAQLKALIGGLIASGDLVITERRKLAKTGNSGIIKGSFVGNARGFGFVEPYAKGVEDIFIPERNINGAVHGDEVLVKLVSENRNRRKYNFRRNDNRSKTGEIIKILKRNLTQIVGVVMIVPGGAVVEPDDKRFGEQVFVSNENLNDAKVNQKVVVKLLTYPSRNQMATGKIIEILGDVNELGVDTLSIVRSYGLTEKFPEEVINEAKKVAIEPDAKAKKGRRDFTKDLVITIDGEDARDFDDAISLVVEKDKYILSVHIADVSHYVKQDSEIDKEAYRRATSVYFPDMVLPMLPEMLSNNICSLNPNVERLSLSVITTFDKKGNVLDYEVVNGVIKSKYRMTYTKVAKIFEGDKKLLKEYSEIVPMLLNMKTLAELLIARRDKAGQLDFDIPEVQIEMNEQQKITNIKRKERTMADRVIEQFMVVTNEVVARFFTKEKLPFVYRIHEVPTPEKIKFFNNFISAMGLNLYVQEIDVTPKDVQKIITTVHGKPLQNIINTMLLRSMQKAKYDPRPIGHFGLALKDYCHFTSPIRRYPDLVIHRIIKLFLNGEMKGKTRKFYDEFVYPASTQSSDREKLADDAERDVDDLKKAEYMLDKVGNVYEGYVCSITENGLFVQLPNTIEGMVPVENLPKDKYSFDEQKMILSGIKTKFKLGQKVVVKVERADLISRRVYFLLATEEDKNKIIRIEI